MKNDDAQLIQRVLAGDDTAFSMLVKKYQKPVHALAWRKVGDFHIAEEITQDTFLKAYQKLAMLKEPQRFLSWLYVIATNHCKAWLRKKRLRTESLENAERVALEKATYSGYVISENEQTAIEAQREVVKALLAKLQESERTIVTLRYFGEMLSAEIGEFLGVSANTVRSRLRRAQERLKREEPMIREALEHFQITPDLTENIMREISRLKPAAPSGGKPFVPWAIGISTLAIVLLMLGVGNQQLLRFQKPYSFNATSKMTVEIIEAPVVLNLESEPDIRTQLGSSTVPNKNGGVGQQPDDVLFAAAQAEGEDVSVTKQQWIQAEPVKGSDVGGLLVTDDGEFYTITYEHIYKMESSTNGWQQITDIDALGTNYRGYALIERWNDTLYMVVDTTLLASKDDGKTWELVHALPVDYGLVAFDLELTERVFYIIFSDYTAFQSEDLGKTWKAVNVGFPQRPNAMVTIQGTLFAGTDNGLYRLKDDNWERVEFPDPVGEILSIAATEGKIYVAAKFRYGVTSSQKVRQGLARGWWIFRSTDLGNSWDDITPTNAWPPNGWPPEITLVATGETLLAMEKGMVRSTDGGDTWLPPQLPGTSPLMDRFNSGVVVNEGTIYVRSPDGLYCSIDAGISWNAVNINRQDFAGIYNPIAYKGQNMPPTLYAMFGGKIVKTTNKGKSWRTIQMGTPMAAPVREEPPTFTQIREFGGILYAKTMGSHSPGNAHKTGLYRISAENNTVVPMEDMSIFDSHELSRFWNIGRTGALDVSDQSFIEQLKEKFVGADQFFKTLTRGGTFRQEELYKQDLYQDQIRLIRRGISGAFVVSGDTFYVEYNFKLFRWEPGDTEWYDTELEETAELDVDVWHKIMEGFKLTVSGNTVYVGKRDGHLVVSFDRGNNWIDVTPILPFPVKVFKEIVFAGSTVYVATDAGVATSSEGKRWRAITDTAGTHLIMERLAVDGTNVYGASETSVYQLESDGVTWKQLTPEVSDRVTSLAVDRNVLYVGTQSSGMLHFTVNEE
jgi:RNA polymerase sigma factor (sigma-70 family)